MEPIILFLTPHSVAQKQYRNKLSEGNTENLFLCLPIKGGVFVNFTCD